MCYYLLYVSMYNLCLCFWPKLSGKNVSFYFLIQLFIYIGILFCIIKEQSHLFFIILFKIQNIIC